MTTTQGAHASLVGILSFLLFLSWWRVLKRRSNHPETVWIPLEARHLNSFKNSFKETCKYVFPYILDDRIICSWWLGVLNIWFNEFRCIWCFDQNFRKLSTSNPIILYLWLRRTLWHALNPLSSFLGGFFLWSCKILYHLPWFLGRGNHVGNGSGRNTRGIW